MPMSGTHPPDAPRLQACTDLFVPPVPPVCQNDLTNSSLGASASQVALTGAFRPDKAAQVNWESTKQLPVVESI
jgi:hypothetical protein